MGKILDEPAYPVVDAAPGFAKTVGNFSATDVATAAGVASLSLPFGYLAGSRESPAFSRVSGNILRPSIKTALTIGAFAGFLIAYQNSSARLQGFSKNDVEAKALRR